MVYTLIPYIFFASTLLVYLYAKLASNAGIVDQQNARSSHTNPTPRGGGIVFAFLWIATVFIQWHWFDLDKIDTAALILPALICATIGFIDDLRPLSARLRLACHLTAAACCLLVVYYSSSLIPAANPILLLAGLLLGALAFSWSINLYNFMDGLDGLAAMEGIFVFGFGGLILFTHGVSHLASTAWLLAAAIAGFLVWNFPRAKVFMGDVGSGFLGAAVAAFSIIGHFRYQVSAVFWLMLLGVFWFDASLTLLSRLYRSDKVYEAHREHAYQKLHHGAKWSHGKILAYAALLNTLIAGLTLAANVYPQHLLYALAIEIALLTTAYVAAHKLAQPLKKLGALE